MVIYWAIHKYAKEKTQTLIQDSREIGLEVNSERTKYMFIPHHQSSDLPSTNIASRNVAKFK